MSTLDDLKEFLSGTTSVEASHGRTWVDENWRSLRSVGDSASGYTVVDEVEGDDRRWSRAITVIVENSSGETFSFIYDHGLTEMQEDEFYGSNSVFRVEKTEKTVVITSWDQVV